MGKINLQIIGLELIRGYTLETVSISVPFFYFVFYFLQLEKSEVDLASMKHPCLKRVLW